MCFEREVFIYERSLSLGQLAVIHLVKNLYLECASPVGRSALCACIKNEAGVWGRRTKDGAGEIAAHRSLSGLQSTLHKHVVASPPLCHVHHLGCIQAPSVVL